MLSVTNKLFPKKLYQLTTIRAMSNVSKPASKFGETVGLTGAPVFIKSDNIVQLIVADHNKAKKLYEEYKASEDLDTKKTKSKELIRDLVAHDECEQLLVYPLLREKVGGDIGEGHYDRSLHEHQEHRELLYDVNQSDIKKDPKVYDEKLAKAMESVLHHVEQEENEVLPLLSQHCSEDELKRVGASFKAHKPLSATNPHPSAPAQGFPAALASVVLKPFDMARDFLTGNK